MTSLDHFIIQHIDTSQDNTYNNLQMHVYIYILINRN